MMLTTIRSIPVCHVSSLRINEQPRDQADMLIFLLQPILRGADSSRKFYKRIDCLYNDLKYPFMLQELLA